MILGRVLNAASDVVHEVTSRKKKSHKIIRGTVVLVKNNVFGFNTIHTTVADSVFELIGKGVTLQLVSADNADPANENGGKLGKLESLENWNLTCTPLACGDSLYKVSFEWDEEIGTPGAIILRNNHAAEFFLKTITLEDVPGAGRIHFLCNSWVYPDRKYKKPRVFFSNKTYLPHVTPAPLLKYREEELKVLRGDGKRKLKKRDRVYDYDCYNDLGNPDKGAEHARPVLGGSAEYPYPRRGRTSRPPSRSDPNTESRCFLPFRIFNVYVPRDEQFGNLKASDFVAFGLKGLVKQIIPLLEAIVDLTPNEIDSFKELDNLYFNGLPLPTNALNQIVSQIPLPMMKEFFRRDGKQLLKFPVPQVIKEKNKTTAWRTDEEFAREMVAGVNPLLIRLLKEFPPTSKLDPEVYGHQNSCITKEEIEYNLEGLSVEEALGSNRLFILDHHDSVIPYLRRLNSTTGTKIHASRTILFLRGDSTLKPVAIELSLPHLDGDKFGVVSKVYTPADHGVEGSIWQFAKAFVVVNDSGHHQLISHWLNTHAVLEPFVIATNRQLSVIHPIYKLLHPHYRDTMAINALAREILVNAGGLLEKTFYPSKYSLEMSSHIYKSWNFMDQALPTDLKKRGIAVDDENSQHGLRLLITDYPYAVDGLNIWFALEKWVRDYCSFYYETDKMVQEDPELQAWWKELREVGHGDKKHEPWWPKMQTREELIESCTIIIWIASALHAAVNFGQYAYGGYYPNRPTLSRRFMPEKGTPEYSELERNPERAFFRTMAPQLQCLTGITVVEILSKHPSDEVYLGQRTPGWTTHSVPLAAFEAFNKRLAEIEGEILKMNMDKKLKNRVGPVNVPYTLLYPTGEVGLSGKGIPNSISI
ncbi:probable linoleate 9S-lipoxygenase 5 [Durio zibethinus]|uniref:Lipoxygenase n=1 Tax=Durio zibethinus TaxID=66656 RepID=A0A6P5YQA0_DURZI|nr:probable linoleate 9S-lipoxygenase 5 [Durio zibethinus]